MKIIALVSVTVLLMSIACGCQMGQVQCDDGITICSSDSVESELTPASEEAESLTDKYTREIDDAYAEEMKLPGSGTTLGLVQMSAKYADMWAVVADEYYQKLMTYEDVTDNSLEYTADDLHSYISNMKENWERYYQVQCENYNETLRVIYDRGTIVGPIAGDHRYKLQKEWALLILDICDQLDIR